MAKDYEKKYKEIVGLIKKAYLYAQTDSTKAVLEEILPELAESEDERIRKAIYNCVKWFGFDSRFFNDVSQEECLVWIKTQGETFTKKDVDDAYLKGISDAKKELEKQVEQKPVISDDALREGIAHFGIIQYQIDNWLKKYVDVEKQGEQKSVEFDDTNAKRMFIKALERVEEQNNKGYKLTDCDKNSWWEDFKAYTSCTIEQKPADITDEWIEEYWQHEKVNNPYSYNKGDEIQFDYQGFVSFCKKYCQKPAWSEEEVEIIDWLVASFDCLKIPTDTFYQSKVRPFLISLRNKIQPIIKEWSEEDEQAIEDAETWLDTLCDYLKDSSPECIPTVKNVINKLKSLRPQKSIDWTMQDEEELQIALDTLVKAGQHSSAKWLKNVCLVPQNHWKPSDEQMDALETATSSLQSTALESLYNELKKL